MNYNSFFLKDRLNDDEIGKFKLFEDEEFIFACREHLLLLLLRLTGYIVLGLLSAVAFFSLSYILLQSVSLAILAFSFVTIIFSMAFVRELIHWSFHLYIATNRQIIEVRYDPLLSQAVNSVLLDQIRCTEIDVEMFGLVPELFGIGDVEVTFDRPTHKEILILKSIRSPRAIANLLSTRIYQKNYLIQQPNQQIGRSLMSQPLWTKELEKNKYRFIGDSRNNYVSN